MGVAVREKGSVNSLRMQLTQLLFKTQPSSNKKVDTNNYEKPLAIPAGADSFDGILKSPPKGTDASDFVGDRGVRDDALVRWKEVMADMLGQPKRVDEDDTGEEEKEDNRTFLEPCVDEMRAQKDAALVAYKKE